MDSNPYAFNRDVSYPTCAGFPRNMTCKDILEAHIQVVIPEKVSDGRGDFTAEVEDIFDHYRLPHISSEKILNRWHQSPMDFYQNQVNLAVWLATSGCGVSWRDHLDIDRPLARSVFRFHVYYQVRRILEELQAPLPQDRAWSPFQNPYDLRAYERICREFGVDPATDWRANGPNRGLGRVYNYWTNNGYHPVGNGEYDSSKMSFTRQTSNRYIHVDFIKQDAPNADTALTSQRALPRRGLRDWTTASGPTCGRFLAPRRRPAQQSLEQAPASMLRSSSWQTLRMQYRPLRTYRRP